MNSMLKNLQGAAGSLFKHMLSTKVGPVRCDRGIHQICSQHSSTLVATSIQGVLKPINYFSTILKSTSFLIPTLPQFNQVCGMKVRGHLERRCKGCYYVTRQGRLYVMCHLKPRHKQTQMLKKFRNRHILTFACQKKVRDW